MCGILGVRRAWLADEERWQRAMAATSWRGPDGSRSEDVGGWRLGVARLAISDPGTPQPMHCPETGRTVVFNGADTGKEREWERFADRAVSRNDAELCLLRMRADGPAAVAPTSGHYAGAVVDPAHGTLWLFRDPRGEKPLFVVRHNGRVQAFASTLSALRHLGFDVGLGGGARAQLFSYGFATDYAVRAGGDLPPGDWQLDTELAGVWEDDVEGGWRQVGTPPTVPPSREGLGDRLRDAVRRCSAADVPVALTLSGGIDSACVAAAVDDRVPAYQFQAHGADSAERSVARAVARHLGLELREIDGDASLLEALPELVRGVGVPLGDPSVLAVWSVARAAAADGVRVLLTGEGSDELGLGYRRHRVALALGGARWPLPAPRGGRGAVARVLRAAAAEDTYANLLEVTTPAERAALLQPEFDHAPLPLPGRTQPVADRIDQLDREAYLRWDLLPKLDTATMAAGIEGRCPFLDPSVQASPDVIDTPPRRRLGKRALRDAFRVDLPAAVFRQPKRGFAVPLDTWFAGDADVLDVLTDPRTRQREHLRQGALQAMLDAHRDGRARHGFLLYLALAVELGLRERERVPCA